MEKLDLKIIKPQETVLEDSFEHIIIPGKAGDFGIYPGHTPFISVIRPGILELYNGENVDKYALHDGYVTVENDQVTILCEVIEHKDQIDIKRAQSAKKRAEDRIKSGKEDIDFRRAEIALKRALARLDISE